MRASSFIALYGFMLLLGLAGCAASIEYTPRPVPDPIEDEMPARVSERGVAIGADPYSQPDRQEAFFGLRLGQKGILPIQLLIRNDRDVAILVRPYEMAILLPDGRAVAPVGAEQTVGRALGAPVQFSSVGRSAVYSAPAAGASAGPLAYGAAGGLTVLAGIVLLREINTQRELYRQLFFDYRAKELHEITLKKGEFRHGFVYFIFPPDMTFPSDITLAIRVIDTENATAFVVKVPLTHVDLRVIDR